MTVAVRRPFMIGRGGALQLEVQATLGFDLNQCLECGKCTGGCSTGAMFDYTPRKIVQLVKLGAEDTLLHMDALSICVGCGLCHDRCPVGIDVAAILDYFRGKAQAQAIPLTRGDVELFNRLFLDCVRTHGRISELPLMVRFNMGSKRYFKDAGLGKKLLLKGKLRLIGPRVKDKVSLQRLFEGSAAVTPLPRPAPATQLEAAPEAGKGE